MSRKTISVEAVKALVNRRLDALDTSKEQRRELGHLLESVLHQTGNYKGFRYLPSEHAEEPPYAPGTTHLKPGYDDTRRSYL